jgi:hypothetical protein
MVAFEPFVEGTSYCAADIILVLTLDCREDVAMFSLNAFDARLACLQIDRGVLEEWRCRQLS